MRSRNFETQANEFMTEENEFMTEQISDVPGEIRWVHSPTAILKSWRNRDHRRPPEIVTRSTILKKHWFYKQSAKN